MKGTITISLEGASFEETERCREIIHTLLEAGVFAIRNGKAVLNFNLAGELAEIEMQIKRYKKDKPVLITQQIEQFKVSTEPINKSSIAKRV